MNAYSQYQENQILSASPEQILLMLYDGAIRFTHQAMHGLEDDNLALFHNGIKKSMAIISEFSNSLNHQIGGEIAENLDALYSFMIRELTLGNLHKDIEKLKVVERLLVDLRATWEEAAEISKGQIPADTMLALTDKNIEKKSILNSYVPLSISR
jgi:flagellar secretion chaperone FliS